MRQTENTAIVLRYANYRENDRMLTLFSPTRGRIDALARGCRKPRSPLVNAAELFALGDFDLFEKNGRQTLTGVRMIEHFYPLRQDFDRLACGSYLLGLCEAVIQSGEPEQALFMLLLHGLSRLTYSDQEWKPLLAGFLLHFAEVEGFKPRLNHCIRCQKRLTDAEPVFFDEEEGGLCCAACKTDRLIPVAPQQAVWMRQTLRSPASAWVNTPEAFAPYQMLRRFVEAHIDKPIQAAAMLPKG